MTKKHHLNAVKSTRFDRFFMTHKRYIKQPLLEGDSEKDFQATLNAIYKQQMLQLLNFLNNEPMRYQELIVIDERASQISNYFGLMKVYNVMS